MARKTKKTLYIVFIDYEKAYDRVDRNTLLQNLAQSGCGSRFLCAIANMLKCTKSIIGSDSFEAKAGVRQGGSTSCSLFTYFINATITKINEFGVDGFLGTLHCLLLMDDTAIVATSRAAMEAKLNLLIQSTNELKHTKIHPVKSRFFAINTADKDPFIVEDIVISHTDQYVYLGATLSNDSIKHQVAKHMAAKQSHARKFYSFLSKNSDAPFCVKKHVWDSALNSAILYGCESWLVKDLKDVQSVYLATVKALLGVRVQTPTDLVYIELDIPSAQAMIMKRQMTFISKYKERDSYDGSPLQIAVELAKQFKSPMGKYLAELETMQNDPVSTFKTLLHERVYTLKAQGVLHIGIRIQVCQCMKCIPSQHVFMKNTEYLPPGCALALTDCE